MHKSGLLIGASEHIKQLQQTIDDLDSENATLRDDVDNLRNEISLHSKDNISMALPVLQETLMVCIHLHKARLWKTTT